MSGPNPRLSSLSKEMSPTSTECSPLAWSMMAGVRKEVMSRRMGIALYSDLSIFNDIHDHKPSFSYCDCPKTAYSVTLSLTESNLV